MSEPTERSLAAPLRAIVGWVEKFVIAATAIIALQALALLCGVLPSVNWYAGLFLFAGLVALFGSIALLFFRRSIVWVLTLAISLLVWTLAYFVLWGIGIARMH